MNAPALPAPHTLTSSQDSPQTGPALALRVQLDHLNLTVRDLDASLAFYQGLFGFEPVEAGVRDGQRWAIVRADAVMLCMYEAPKRRFLGRFELGRAGHHGINHFALRIDQPELFHTRREAMGVEVMYGGVVDWPHSDSWYIEDPTGYEIEVVHWHDKIAFPEHTEEDWPKKFVQA